MIDFEKLKIENQNLIEKIELRNEEIYKESQRGKINLETLSHLIQKCNQLKEDNQKLKEELDSLMDTYGSQRVELPRIIKDMRIKKKKYEYL